MITEFDKYSMSGVLICVCGMSIMMLGVIKPGAVKCDKCERAYMIHRPVIELLSEGSEDIGK